MDILLNVEFEKAIRLLVERLPISDVTTRKPILAHDIRVGVYLYENGYPRDIVLAGLLHDLFENSDYTQESLSQEFDENVVKLVTANTKDDSIEKAQRNEDMIKRCTEAGEAALIVKAADTLDSFKYYLAVNNQDQLQNHCQKIAALIFKYKPANFVDKIFVELQKFQAKANWYENCSFIWHLRPSPHRPP